MNTNINMGANTNINVGANTIMNTNANTSTSANTNISVGANTITNTNTNTNMGMSSSYGVSAGPGTVIIDSMHIDLGNEKNLLEVIRKAGIELPTFCYHSDISVYGACRMCMVEVEGRGILPACSTAAENGMVVRTNTKQVRAIRKMIIELMMANHNLECTTCPRSEDCRLQSISKQLGIKEVRFKRTEFEENIDLTSTSIVRAPDKCILCGDCVRVCDEIQSVGALDFAHRGARAHVVTCFNRGIGEVECINCGQCVKSCPVGALTIKTNITEVLDAIFDDEKIVVAQIAPAVRVALGEYFGEPPGSNCLGKIVSALRIIGFDRVFDTCFGADFTVVEEGKEFLDRFRKGERLPLFTSCCPAWVKFAEQYYPDLLNNLSSTRSPIQMFGSLCKFQLSSELNIPRENIVVVSITPCTAKKFECARDEFKVNGNADVDHVITTEELARMIKEHGIDFSKLEHSSLDMPLSFSTGSAIIFGSTGGVSEAVLRFVANELGEGPREFKQFRGHEGVKVGEINIGGKALRLGVVSGLANARKLIDKIHNGEENFDIVEVMACLGGCVNGGGQPVRFEHTVNMDRAKGLFNNDRMLQFHVSSENPFLQKIYRETLDEKKAHELLHTTFNNRRLIKRDDFVLSAAREDVRLELTICFGRSCFKRGAQDLYGKLMAYVRERGFDAHTELKAKFCGKICQKGPVLEVNGKSIESCTYEKAVDAINDAINAAIAE